MRTLPLLFVFAGSLTAGPREEYLVQQLYPSTQAYANIERAKEYRDTADTINIGPHLSRDELSKRTAEIGGLRGRAAGMLRIPYEQYKSLEELSQVKQGDLPLELEQELAACWHAYANVLHLAGQYKKGIEAVDQSLKFRQDNPKYLYIRGVLSAELGDLLTAKSYLSEAYRLEKRPKMKSVIRKDLEKFTK